MNDGGYAALTPERAQEYRDGMTRIVDTFKKSGVRFIVVGSPGAVDTKFFKFGATSRRSTTRPRRAARHRRQVAEEQGVAFADVHGVMMDVMAKAKAKYGEDYPVAGKDGVHPIANGHLVMAYAFLKAPRLRRQHRHDHGRLEERSKSPRVTATKFRATTRGTLKSRARDIRFALRALSWGRSQRFPVQPGPQSSDAEGHRDGSEEIEGHLGQRNEEVRMKTSTRGSTLRRNFRRIRLSSHSRKRRPRFAPTGVRDARGEGNDSLDSESEER